MIPKIKFWHALDTDLELVCIAFNEASSILAKVEANIHKTWSIWREIYSCGFAFPTVSEYLSLRFKGGVMPTLGMTWQNIYETQPNPSPTARLITMNQSM